MPLFFGDKIREARKAAGLTQRQLADKINVTNTSISNWEKNLSRPDPDTIQNLCWALNVQPNYLFGENEAKKELPPGVLPLPEMKEWPVIGATACGDPIHREVFDETVWAPMDINAEAVFRCDGDSMINARIFDGDLVFINTSLQVDDGQIALVRIGEEYTLKRIYRGEGVLQLVAENPAYPIRVISGTDLEDTEIVGKAVYFMSRVI